jgi:hypothetical protein
MIGHRSIAMWPAAIYSDLVNNYDMLKIFYMPNSHPRNFSARLIQILKKIFDKFDFLD